MFSAKYKPFFLHPRFAESPPNPTVHLICVNVAIINQPFFFTRKCTGFFLGGNMVKIHPCSDGFFDRDLTVERNICRFRCCQTWILAKIGPLASNHHNECLMVSPKASEDHTVQRNSICDRLIEFTRGQIDYGAYREADLCQC